MKKQNDRLPAIPTFFKLLPIVVKTAPGAFVLDNLTGVVSAVVWALVTLATQVFFDKTTLLITNNEPFASVIRSLVLLCLTYIATQVLSGVGAYLSSYTKRIIIGRLTYKIHEKMGKIPPISFENTERLDDIVKAEDGCEFAYDFVKAIIKTLTFYLPYFFVIGWYLLSLRPILLWVIPIVFIPTIISQLMLTDVFAHLTDESAPIKRQFQYYEKTVTDREYFKETRLLGIYSLLLERYIDRWWLMTKLHFKAVWKSTYAMLGSSLLTILGYAGILWLLVDSVSLEFISVGAFAAVFASIRKLFSMTSDAAREQMGIIAEDFGSVANFVRFIEIPERKGKAVNIPKDEDISFENVSFRYPGAKKLSIENINFTIKHGETLAVVGENGAGKSTFIRLLTGIYSPTEGTVRCGDVNLETASFSALREGLSAVFQKFRRYQMTLGENLAVARGKLDCDEGILRASCGKAGIDPDGKVFPGGFDTVLSREMNEDGDETAELSGGEWQRVAIARAFCREHKLIILDEPTSAIDPIEESRTYDRFAELSRGKTAIIVTHRLGSVRLANKILVLKEGKIAEVGTHEMLIHSNGEYARLYESQKQWYV